MAGWPVEEVTASDGRLHRSAQRIRLAEPAVPADRPALKADLARIADGLADAVQAVREIARGIHPASPR